MNLISGREQKVWLLRLLVLYVRSSMDGSCVAEGSSLFQATQSLPAFLTTFEGIREHVSRLCLLVHTARTHRLHKASTAHFVRSSIFLLNVFCIRYVGIICSLLLFFMFGYVYYISKHQQKFMPKRTAAKNGRGFVDQPDVQSLNDFIFVFWFSN